VPGSVVLEYAFNDQKTAQTQDGWVGRRGEERLLLLLLILLLIL